MLQEKPRDIYEELQELIDFLTNDETQSVKKHDSYATSTSEDNHVMTADEIDALFYDDKSVNSIRNPTKRYANSQNLNGKSEVAKACNDKPSTVIYTMANPDDPAMNGYELKVTLIKSEIRRLDKRD